MTLKLSARSSNDGEVIVLNQRYFQVTPRLSPHTRQLVEVIFDSKDVAEASQWLEDECGNRIPFYEESNEYDLERIRFAAIKLSQGNLNNLLKAIDLAQIDWRDLLMGAGFGNNVRAHEKWMREILGKT